MHEEELCTRDVRRPATPQSQLGSSVMPLDRGHNVIELGDDGADMVLLPITRRIRIILLWAVEILA